MTKNKLEFKNPINVQEQAITEVQRSEEAPLKNNSRIPVRITPRNRMISVNGSVNHTVLSNVKRQSKSYGIPSIILANVRSIAKKLDELHQLALYNNVGMICITETWLTSNIPDSSVSIPGFNLFRKDSGSPGRFHMRIVAMANVRVIVLSKVTRTSLQVFNIIEKSRTTEILKLHNKMGKRRIVELRCNSNEFHSLYTLSQSNKEPRIVGLWVPGIVNLITNFLLPSHLGVN